MYSIEGTDNFKDLNITLTRSGKKIKVSSLKPTDSPKTLDFNITIDGETITGTGTYGDDAVWLPCGEYGIKIIKDNSKYHSLEETLSSIREIASYKSLMFPHIWWAELIECEDESLIIAKVENITQAVTSKIGFQDSYLPTGDRHFIEKHLPAAIFHLQRCIRDLNNYQLLPEDEWHKPCNIINGRVVDFHRFRVFPERYSFKSNGRTVEDLNKTYKAMVKRYADNLDSAGGQKWKGRIYQGFMFDNGAVFEGYASATDLYDSYRKLPFTPLNKVAGKKVLDLGSNQGFFSFQAAIHGASEVTGLEITKQDLAAAADIKEILQYDNVTFLEQDAVEFLRETTEQYELIVAASVIHQIYNDLEGADEMLSNIASKCNYFAFETPVNHPTMKISLEEIYNTLSRHFNKVKLVNVYDAYSSGYRANFVCYAHHIK